MKEKEYEDEIQEIGNIKKDDEVNMRKGEIISLSKKSKSLKSSHGSSENNKTKNNNKISSVCTFKTWKIKKEANLKNILESIIKEEYGNIKSP